MPNQLAKSLHEIAKQNRRSPGSTNADRIRAMSNEELAEWLTQEDEEHAYIQCSRCVCDKSGMCTEETICARGVLAWLRQPAEGN